MQLISAVTSNSNGDTQDWGGKSNNHLNTRRTVYAYGTWDTATVTIQISPDSGTTWFNVTSGAFTADGYLTFEARATSIRAVVSSVGASTSVSALLL